MPVIPALGRLRQKGPEWGYIARPNLNMSLPTKKRRKKPAQSEGGGTDTISLQKDLEDVI
jgi:hypothetical protein